MILGKMKSIAENFIGEQIRDAVITVLPTLTMVKDKPLKTQA